MKTDLFHSCSLCWVFHICWNIKWNTLTAPSFRIWNSSAGIPSFPLVLFTVIPPKAHLSSYSKMSGYGWVITPSWLSGSLRSFVLYFCVFLPPLLNLFCFCYILAISVLYCVHLCMKYSLGISHFVEVISRIKYLLSMALVQEQDPVYSIAWPSHQEACRRLLSSSIKG